MPAILAHEPAYLRVSYNVIDGWIWEIISGGEIVDAGFGFDQKDARSWGEYALAQFSR